MSNTKLATGLKWGIGLGAAALLAPYVALAIGGIVGIGVAIVLGLIIVHFSPTISSILANQALKLLKWDVRKNPVTTMENILLRGRERYEEQAKMVKTYAGAVSTFETHVKTLAKDFPEDAANLQGRLDDMKRMLAFKYAAQRNLNAELLKYEKQIDRARALWAAAQAGEAVDALSGVMTKKQAIDRIKNDTAIQAIEDSLNRSSAQLDYAVNMQELPKEPEALQLITDQSVVPLNVRVSEKVRS